MLNFILGCTIGSVFLEPLIINFIYFTNPGLFVDLILTKKNRKKLFQLYKEIEELKKADIEIWGDEFE